jgi:hypothetical protein
MAHPDPDLPALGIQQPWAELILRGIKTIEVRAVDTNIRGRIYLYASKRLSAIAPAVKAAERYRLDLESLPRGVLVGSVEIADTAKCDANDAKGALVPSTYLDGQYAWQLRNAERLETPLPVRFLPYGMWFYPFKRRGGRRRRSPRP